jgi:hypothetical protein
LPDRRACGSLAAVRGNKCEGNPMKKAIATAALLALLTSAAQAVSYDVYRVCGLDPNGDNFLALRSGPSSNSAMIAKLGPGTELHGNWFPERDGNWMQVYAEDWTLEGWVFVRYTCLISDH